MLLYVKIAHPPRCPDRQQPPQMLVMHSIKILDIFFNLQQDWVTQQLSELLWRLHLRNVILHLASEKRYPCPLQGTGNSHFYCSWPDLLHLPRNHPFLFLLAFLRPNSPPYPTLNLPLQQGVWGRRRPLTSIYWRSNFYKSQVESQKFELTYHQSIIGQFQPAVLIFDHLLISRLNIPRPFHRRTKTVWGGPPGGAPPPNNQIESRSIEEKQ